MSITEQDKCQPPYRPDDDLIGYIEQGQRPWPGDLIEHGPAFGVVLAVILGCIGWAFLIMMCFMVR